MKNLRRGEVVSVWLAVLGLALILGSPLAFAQQGNGTVSGTVRDASGAVVPGASVVLRNEASGTELRTTSDTSGLFVLNYVPVATYTLTVSSKGFKKSEQTGIHVAPDAALQEDATLQVDAGGNHRGQIHSRESDPEVVRRDDAHHRRGTDSE